MASKKAPPPAKKTNKVAKSKAPKVVKPVVPKDTKNNVTRPKEGSTTRKIWDLADKAKAANGHNNNRGEVLAAAEKLKINEATAATQFGKWRVYNGITGRVAKPKAPKVAPKKKPAPPKAPSKKKAAPPAPPAASEAPATVVG